jgi:hypothetical protein
MQMLLFIARARREGERGNKKKRHRQEKHEEKVQTRET